MKLKPTKPIRDKYNPTPSAKEKRFHFAMMEGQCEACGIEPCGVFHHLLTDTPEKRWRRDHTMGLPLCDPCHRDLHADGDEWAWCAARGFDAVERALFYRNWKSDREYYDAQHPSSR